MDLIGVIGFASLPFIANFIGGRVAERFDLSDRIASLALHWAAGSIIGVLAIQMIPKVMKAQPIWPVLTALFAGGCLGVCVDMLINKLQHKKSGQKDKSNDKGPWAIYSAVFIDLLNDGVTIGTSASISSNFALLLVAGLGLGDFPEGAVTVNEFKNSNTSKKFRLLANLSLMLPVLGAAVLSFTFLKDRPEVWKLTAIALTAGMLLRAAIEDMLKKAHKKTDQSNEKQFIFILAFVLYAVAAAYLGQDSKA